MTRFLSSRSGLLTLLVLLSGGGAGLVCGLLSCTGGNPTPGAVIGPMVSGNRPPTLTITEPFEDLSVGQGSTFVIRWTDSDPDSNARISFELVDIVNPARIVPLVEGLEENDLDANMQPTPETFLASTGVVTPGSYHVRGTIRDGINAPVQTFATLELSETGRVVLTVTEPGLQPPSRPPTVVVTAPGFNLSVAQDDELVISVQPTLNAPAEEFPYDSDSDATLYILLDVDEDPTNDNPANPDPDEIIVLQEEQLEAGFFDELVFTEAVDVATMPVRADGRPYFVRATIQDPTNDPVHAYASGTINVAQAASGTVDLGLMGKTLLGVTFQGFNPGSNLGSRMITARDFDADGVEDFLLVARFGNPRNFGNIGEAYLIYGLDEVRFGGSINVNSTSTDISGTIFEAPPVRFAAFAIVSNPRTEGITDVATIGDLNGDGRPELLFGLPHVDGILQGRDDDPGDDPIDPDTTIPVELILRQGFRQITVGGQDPVQGNYAGFQDTYIDSANPGRNFRSEQYLEWDNDGLGDRRWTLIRITDVLTQIPDRQADIAQITRATLTLRVVNAGDEGTVHECFHVFTDGKTFNDFAVSGAGDEPQGGDPGDEDVDYDQTPLGSVGGPAGQSTGVDITRLIQRLIDGELAGVDDLVLLIIVPEGENETQVRSSEFGEDEEQRPTLTISYQRRVFVEEFGCYPDHLANNRATVEPEEDDVVNPGAPWEALGSVALINSDNRDNDPRIAEDPRLEATVVALELAGQEIAMGDGLIVQRADNGDEVGRIAGCRFQVGWYDMVDHLSLNQPPLEALFGWNVDSMPDLDNDGIDEIIISAPNNEQDIKDLEEGAFTPFSTHLASRGFFGSIIVLTGTDYNVDFWRDKNGEEGCSSIPINANVTGGRPPSCNPQNPVPRVQMIPRHRFEVFAEDGKDFLGGGRYAGDFNLDGVPDIMAGAPLNDLNDPDEDTREGASYVIYGRVPVGDYDLSLADNPLDRPPMLRVRGETPGDRIGWRQELLGDVNGDRIADIVISSPSVDFGDAARPSCAGDFDGDGDVDSDDLSNASFEPCLGHEVFTDDECKVFDYDNDRMITEDDRAVLECLREEAGGCCPVDNGFVGVIFGGVTIDGDREISQVATSDLPGTIFFGTSPGDRAGADVSSAGDFNLDGFDDLLIAAPGERRLDANGQTRLGVVYLIFGGPHLTNATFNLALGGTDDLPGIVFLSPYAEGRPDEAPPDHVGFLGDINNDGFADIAIGNTRADFIDVTLPQEPAEPGTVPGTGRRPDAGDVYIVYGNNFGSNR